MSEAGLTIIVPLGVGDAAERGAELVHRMAAQCCEGDDASFVMITTDHSGAQVVKTVEFETPAAARRFRSLMTSARPASSGC